MCRLAWLASDHWTFLLYDVGGDVPIFLVDLHIKEGCQVKLVGNSHDLTFPSNAPIHLESAWRSMLNAGAAFVLTVNL